MNVEELQTYAKEKCFIDDEDQFHAMLIFYHNLGMIVKHRSTVILKAQWLIQLFKMLITIPPFDKAVGNVTFKYPTLRKLLASGPSFFFIEDSSCSINTVAKKNKTKVF